MRARVLVLALCLCAGAACAVPSAQPAGDVPEGKTVPPPPGVAFNGCDAEGKGGDKLLSVRKNRQDEADAWIPVSFAAILDLPWPATVNRKPRSDWRDTARKQVERYEGTPVSVEAYVAGAQLEKGEACNCGSLDKTMHDVHIWLTEVAGEGKTEAIVAEVSPRIRARHADTWTTKRISKLAQGEDSPRVRVSGWLLLDEEHPEQLEQTRGTLWEIHPVMQIEVRQGDQWIKFDDWNP